MNPLDFLSTSPAPGTSFPRQKLAVTVFIMAGGMLLALAWCALQGWGLGNGYPSNTFLFLPFLRFGDWSDLLIIASLPNPYLDPTAFYLPFQWLCLRWLSWLPLGLQLTGCFFVCMGVLFLLLDEALRSVVPNGTRRAGLALLLLGTCYPLLFCFDRANVEIILVALFSAALYLLSRARYGLAAIALTLAMSLKLPAAFLLILFVRQRRPAMVAGCVAGCAAITVLSLLLLGCPLETSWHLFLRNLTFYTQHNLYENATIEGCASLWNAYKVLLLGAGALGWIRPVYFNFDSEFIQASYAIYVAAMVIFTCIIMAYVCVLERRYARSIIALLLLISISAPSGGDYRLLYAGMALALLISVQERRRNDLLATILLALAMVPKKEIFLPFAGGTESGFADVSIQVLLNPLFVLLALALLLLDSRREINLRWSHRRFAAIMRSLRPGLRRAAATSSPTAPRS